MMGLLINAARDAEVTIDVLEKELLEVCDGASIKEVLGNYTEGELEEYFMFERLLEGMKLCHECINDIDDLFSEEADAIIDAGLAYFQIINLEYLKEDVLSIFDILEKKGTLAKIRN